MACSETGVIEADTLWGDRGKPESFVRWASNLSFPVPQFQQLIQITKGPLDLQQSAVISRR